LFSYIFNFEAQLENIKRRSPNNDDISLSANIVKKLIMIARERREDVWV
jgi:hypothetical protein